MLAFALRAGRDFNCPAARLETCLGVAMDLRDRLTMKRAQCRRMVLAAALGAMTALGWGCAHVQTHAPVVSATPMGNYMLPAKAPDCAMPVLSDMPQRDFHQVAIVEVYADRSAPDAELRELLRRKACAVGADALVLNAERVQKEGELIRGSEAGQPAVGPGSEDPYGPKHHPVVGEVGHAERYMSGIAIVYPKSPDAAAGSSIGHQ